METGGVTAFEWQFWSGTIIDWIEQKMMDSQNKRFIRPPRIKLTEDIYAHFFEDIYQGSVTELRKRTGLSYRLIYNIVNKRVKSISAREYRVLFGELPPIENLQKVDGTFFRHMVELWLFLNDHASKSDLFREVFGKKNVKRVDYRIFSGKTRTIDYDLERLMTEKFLEYGLDRRTVEHWIEELEIPLMTKDRIPYHQVEPVLRFLEERAGIHPSSILNQYVERYKNGKLKSVSRRVYDRAVALKKKVQQGVQTSDKILMEKVKEEVYGKKEGYTLYVEIEEELKFLQKFARRSPKRYLGRSTTVYERAGCKRIASTRAQRIKQDCAAFIQENPHLIIGTLPRAHQVKWVDRFLNLLKLRVTDLLFQAEGINFEKHILAPLHSSNEYKKSQYGFTQFELAPQALGIKKKVFDLMVATNCEIFKMVGQYDNRWYLSDLYLKELSERKYFDLITAKYEMLARKESLNLKGIVCLQ